MDDIFFAKQKRLHEALTKAALDLMEHTGATAICMPVPGTDPKVFIAVGEPNDIRTQLGHWGG